MKMKFLTVVILSIGLNLNAQQLTTGLSYNYIYSKQLDKAIQTYNFSQPFLTKKQPLFINGLNASLAYVFSNEKQFKHGIHLSYSNFRSLASNENFNNLLNLHFINLDYLFHYENEEKFKKLYAELSAGFTGSGLYRKINGDAFEYDDKKSKSLGVGAAISLKIGYYLIQKSKSSLSSFVCLGYTPYLFAPKNEEVLNATKELTGKNWTGILNIQIGLKYHLKRLNKNDSNGSSR